ncbi:MULTISPECIES: HPP family protein [Psychrobacter]|uniref:HPP family protein n=1 Tax=Psychrobacter TaxID=497 RepID=UPI00280AAFE5|nr:MULTISPECIES: HPP family protein [Psychrobacter]
MNKIFSLSKMQGRIDTCPERLPLMIIALAWVGGTLATAMLALIGNWQNVAMILGSFGASCLLIFAYPESPFAQPRNIVGGHMVTTFTGLFFMSIFGVEWWSMALAVGTAISLMLLLRVPHPPAGSNPLIVMLGGVPWSFLITPTLIGAIVLVVVALIYNNIGRNRHYPRYW